MTGRERERKRLPRSRSDTSSRRVSAHHWEKERGKYRDREICYSAHCEANKLKKGERL